MKVLITGGTGVIGVGTIPRFIERNHQVRLLSRHACDDAKQWPGVEGIEGDVSDPASIRGAADGCDAVLHVAGIVQEEPPDRTFETINVDGTRAILEEASRAGARRFVYVSSLGADRGSSAYHQSKLAAEGLVEASDLDWTIVRPGNVYGPGDEVISLVLKMVRALPAVPIVADGAQEFEPIWYEDLGEALVALLERDDQRRQTLELTGGERTSLKDLLERFAKITGREPFRVPVPMSLAAIAAKITSRALDFPIDETKLTMLREENVIREGAENSISLLLDRPPTTLDRGLKLLADALPEQLPEDGVGSMQNKKFWADIRGGSLSPAGLMTIFCDRITEIMPIEFAAEPGVPTRFEHGATLTAALPMRGNIQVRVEVAEPTRVVCATIEGHPLAGIVEFTTSDQEGAVRFAIEIFTRAANFFDLVAARTVGQPMQDANWIEVVNRVIKACGGTSDGVHQESRTLDDDEAAEVEKGVRQMVQTRQRDEVTEDARA